MNIFILSYEVSKCLRGILKKALVVYNKHFGLILDKRDLPNYE